MPSPEPQTQEDLPDVPQTSAGFRNITPFLFPTASTKGPCSFSKSSVRCPTVPFITTPNPAGAGNTSPWFNFNQNSRLLERHFGPPSIWNAAASRQSYNSRPQGSMSACLDKTTPKRQKSKKYRNIDECR